MYTATEGVVGSFALKVLDLVSAMYEKGLAPLAAAPVGAAAGPVRREGEPGGGGQALKEALAASERTAILFDVNLGSVPTANCDKLNHALSAGIRAAALEKAGSAGGNPSEAVRIADDALSLVSDVFFLGQVTKPANKDYNPDANFHTVPVKLEFEDRGARIHFERLKNSKRASMITSKGSTLMR